MAKGSLFWGKGRGKLGELVLSQLNGQQISRAYQPVVANPKTSLQTNQRAIFANAVKFYKHATQNLFKFAYEDKRATESYYNAFMRHNTGVAMLPNRTSYDNAFFPAIGNQFLLTQGSLPEFTIAESTSAFTSETDVTISNIEEGTNFVSAISRILVSAYGLADGDFITLVRIQNECESISSEPTKATRWDIRQFRIDTNAGSTEIEDILNEQGPEVWTFKIEKVADKMRLSMSCPNDSYYCVGAAIIASRVTDGKVKVSNSYLTNNEVAKTIYQASLQSGYRQGALNSWGRKSDAILQGSIAKTSEERI